MTRPATADTCPRCGSKWTWTGKGWLVVDVHGRASTISLISGPPVLAPPRPLPSCPNCHARVRGGESGSARVEEVRE